jgi:small subunit ribosomal protein S18
MGEQDQQERTSAQPAPQSGSQSGSSSERRSYRSSGPRGERRGGRYVPRPKVCQFCADKSKTIDYKQADQLRRFVSERGKIRPRRQTGTCARHQRFLTTAIKRARHLALLPFVSQQAR